MDKIVYPCPNLNGCTVVVWAWISNFIHIYKRCDYLSMLRLKIIHIVKRGSRILAVTFLQVARERRTYFGPSGRYVYVGVFREFEVWPKYSLWSYCTGCDIVLYCIAIYRYCIVCTSRITNIIWFGNSIKGSKEKNTLWRVYGFWYLCRCQLMSTASCNC